jgi:hypothetical protein
MVLHAPKVRRSADLAKSTRLHPPLNFQLKTCLGQSCIEMQLVRRHTQTAELLITCGQKLVVN